MDRYGPGLFLMLIWIALPDLSDSVEGMTDSNLSVQAQGCTPAAFPPPSHGASGFIRMVATSHGRVIQRNRRFAQPIPVISMLLPLPIHPAKRFPGMASRGSH